MPAAPTRCGSARRAAGARLDAASGLRCSHLFTNAGICAAYRRGCDAAALTQIETIPRCHVAPALLCGVGVSLKLPARRRRNPVLGSRAKPQEIMMPA